MKPPADSRTEKAAFKVSSRLPWELKMHIDIGAREIARAMKRERARALRECLKLASDYDDGGNGMTDFMQKLEELIRRKRK